MSKCNEYIKGGGVNPFWVMDRMEERHKEKYGNDYGSDTSINININIGDLHIDGSFSNKKKPETYTDLVIKKVSKDS